MGVREEIVQLEKELGGHGRFIPCYDKGHIGPIQQFTEICLHCGHNSYETLEEYRDDLLRMTEEGRNKLRLRRQEVKWAEAIKVLSSMPKEQLHEALQEAGLLE